MKHRFVLMFALFSIAASASAQNSDERSSPSDNGPAACMDRDVNSATASCIVKPDGSRTSVSPRSLSQLTGSDNGERSARPDNGNRTSGGAATLPTSGAGALNTDR